MRYDTETDETLFQQFFQLFLNSFQPCQPFNDVFHFLSTFQQIRLFCNLKKKRAISFVFFICFNQNTPFIAFFLDFYCCT